MQTNWGCPFCSWICKTNCDDFDYGLIEAHLHLEHREEGQGLFPRGLLAQTRRTNFICPFDSCKDRQGNPWCVSWSDEGNNSDVDIGLYLIAQHFEALHTETVYRQWAVESAPQAIIPAGALTKLRRVGVRGSPGLRVEV